MWISSFIVWARLLLLMRSLHCIKPGGGIPAYSPTAKREENSAEAPPSAPANDDALLGLEQNCVREIYTHNTLEGSGAATALQNTVTPSLSI